MGHIWGTPRLRGQDKRCRNRCAAERRHVGPGQPPGGRGVCRGGGGGSPVDGKVEPGGFVACSQAGAAPRASRHIVCGPVGSASSGGESGAAKNNRRAECWGGRGGSGGGVDPPGRTPRPTSGPSSAPGFFWGTAFSPLTAPFCVVAAELQELGGLGLGRPGGADGLRVGGWRGLWSGGGIGSSEELSACPSLLNATPYTDPTPTGEQMLEGLRG